MQMPRGVNVFMLASSRIPGAGKVRAPGDAATCERHISRIAKILHSARVGRFAFLRARRAGMRAHGEQPSGSAAGALELHADGPAHHRRLSCQHDAALSGIQRSSRRQSPLHDRSSRPRSDGELLVFAICVPLHASGFSASGLAAEIIEIAVFVPLVPFELGRAAAYFLRRTENEEDT